MTISRLIALSKLFDRCTSFKSSSIFPINFFLSCHNLSTLIPAVSTNQLGSDDLTYSKKKREAPYYRAHLQNNILLRGLNKLSPRKSGEDELSGHKSCRKQNHRVLSWIYIDKAGVFPGSTHYCMQPCEAANVPHCDCSVIPVALHGCQKLDLYIHLRQTKAARGNSRVYWALPSTSICCSTPSLIYPSQRIERSIIQIK